MNRKQFAFGRKNYILIAVSAVLIVIGFLLMTGPNCTNEVFEADIFSVRRIKVAPIVCLTGFLLMIVAIMVRPGKNDNNKKENA